MLAMTKPNTARDEWSLRTVTDLEEAEQARRDRIEAFLGRVAEDARDEPERYLAEALVEDGGE